MARRWREGIIYSAAFRFHIPNTGVISARQRGCEKDQESQGWSSSAVLRRGWGRWICPPGEGEAEGDLIAACQDLRGGDGEYRPSPGCTLNVINEMEENTKRTEELEKPKSFLSMVSLVKQAEAHAENSIVSFMPCYLLITSSSSGPHWLSASGPQIFLTFH